MYNKCTIVVTHNSRYHFTVFDMQLELVMQQQHSMRGKVMIMIIIIFIIYFYFLLRSAGQMSLCFGWSCDRSFGRRCSQLKMSRFAYCNLLLHAYQAALRFKCRKISSLSVRPANLSSQIMHCNINHHVKPLHLTILCSCSCCFCQRDEREKSGCFLIKQDFSSKIKCLCIVPWFILNIFLSCCCPRFSRSVAKRL